MWPTSAGIPGPGGEDSSPLSLTKRCPSALSLEVNRRYHVHVTGAATEVRGLPGAFLKSPGQGVVERHPFGLCLLSYYCVPGTEWIAGSTVLDLGSADPGLSLIHRLVVLGKLLCNLVSQPGTWGPCFL